MANEARVRAGLQIRKQSSDGTVTNLDYQSRPESFQVTVEGSKGPTPGAVTCTTAGTDIDLSQLTTPGLCRIMNMDLTNYVEVGIWDVANALFHPLMEIGPGETYPLKLSRNLGEQYIGVGTGTNPATASRLRVKANTASCVVLVEAFER